MNIQNFRNKLMISTCVLMSAISFAKADTTAGQDLLNSDSASLPLPLSYLKQHNVKLTFIGNEGGNDAYLGEAPGNKMQVFYLSADKTMVIPGVLFGFKGNEMIDETGLQIHAMQERIKAEKSKLNEQTAQADKEKNRLSEAQEQLDNRQKIAEIAEQQLKAGTASSVPQSTPNALPTPSSEPVATSSAAPSNTAPVSNMAKYESKINADDFLKGINDTAWFSVGRPGLPVLYIVADPKCPHCHKVWSDIKNKVFAGKMSIHVIMISGLPGSQEPAVQLLSKAKPGQAWLEGEGSTDTIPVSQSFAPGSPEYKKGQMYVQINNNYAAEHKITGTPWMMYIGRDGKLYHYEGDQDINDFLGAL